MKVAVVAAILAVVGVLFIATPAAAHQLIPGVGGFAAMVLHPLAVTDHLLAIIALGLVSGTSSSTRFDALLLVLTLGVLGGYLVAVLGISPDFAALAPLLLAATSGALTALACRLPFAALAGLAALTGLAVGTATPPEDPAGRAVILTGIGAAIGTALLFTLFAAIARMAERDWQRTGLRVAGSWITACALLVLALAASRAWR